MKSIFTKRAPKPIGPYSQATVEGKFIFCSGQLGINPETDEIPYHTRDQARQILENLKAILEVAKTNFEKVVKTTIYLTDERDFKEVNEVYAQYFDKSKPARSTVIVKALPVWNAKIEIDLIAIIPWEKRLLNIFKN